MSSNSLSPKEQVALLGADCDDLPLGTFVILTGVGKKYYSDQADGGEPRGRMELGVVVEVRGKDIRVEAIEPVGYFSEPLVWFFRGALEKAPYVVRELL